MKKLYLVRHNTEDKLHCYAIKANSSDEALKNAKLYIGDKSLLNKDPINLDNYVVVEEIDSITLIGRRCMMKKE